MKWPGIRYSDIKRPTEANALASGRWQSLENESGLDGVVTGRLASNGLAGK